MLDFWAADGTFEASVAARPAGENGANEYVFYDGPPFANGLPHYGHLLTGYVKDVVPRYRTMRGRRVERRFGWDTHGLPAEVEAEHQLGIKHKSEIEEMGVAEFNDACRTSVLRYTDEWRAYVTRQARWVDFDNDYKTLDLDYMESVMWAFKTLWDKGLVYSGFRVLWYCWRCETPLSSTETKMDDVYLDRQDPAVTVGLRLLAPGSRDLDGAYALVWTTTPWTLPSNLAVAVHPDVEYVLVETADSTAHPGERFVLAAARLAHYARELGDDPRVLRRLTRRRAARHRLRPAVRLLRGPGERAPGAGRRLRHHRRRHRARAHRAGVRRGGQGRHRRGGDRGRRPGEHPRRVRRDRAPVRGHAGVRREPADHPRPARPARRTPRACCCGTRPTTTRTRTAGAAGTR